MPKRCLLCSLMVIEFLQAKTREKPVDLEMACRNEDCTFSGSKKDLETHEMVCECRLVPCPFHSKRCGKLSVKNIIEHSNAKKGRAVRGLPYMTSAKFLDFFLTPPCLQIHATSLTKVAYYVCF